MNPKTAQKYFKCKYKLEWVVQHQKSKNRLIPDFFHFLVLYLKKKKVTAYSF